MKCKSGIGPETKSILVTVVLLFVSVSGCGRPDTTPSAVVKRCVGIPIPVVHEVVSDTTMYKADDFERHIVLKFSAAGLDTLVALIENSQLFSTEYMYSQTEAQKMADKLLEIGLTGYWVPTEIGYMFLEPTLGELPNSGLFNEWWVLHVRVDVTKQTLDFRFVKI